MCRHLVCTVVVFQFRIHPKCSFFATCIAFVLNIVLMFMVFPLCVSSQSKGAVNPPGNLAHVKDHFCLFGAWKGA